ncbi:MAG: GGDEF domain-containing protein [Rhizobiales bacterium]|nr:GGDEF domain-containing protein [Hyphomicrobiales bacterium]
MLNVFTLWIVFIVNCIALGVVWIYVGRCYPNFNAARYWAAGALILAGACLISLLREAIDPFLPLWISATLVILACCVIGMGIERFYGQPVSWRASLAIVVGGFVAIGLSAFTSHGVALRLCIYSVCQSIPIAMSLRLLVMRGGGRPGSRLAAAVGVLIIAVNLLRSGISLRSGEVSMLHFTPFQTALVLALVFLVMAWNFGFVLLSIDRLRAEVADLALFDDLTGVANRRQLLARLHLECARAQQTQEPFALLLLDLDGFKEINDGYGHAAGDECLRQFSLAAQSRLRAGDLLARMGGDEFCVVLPQTTLREGAMIARHLLEACRAVTMQWQGRQIALSASIGVAQWRPEIAKFPDRLIAAADRALYGAKRDGKNGYAVYDSTPLSAANLPSLRASA